MSLTDVSTVTDSISIVLIDDHPIVRSGISTLMSLTNDLNVVGEAESVATAIELLGQVDPDIAVLDLRLPDGPGLDVARWIAENRRRTRCVVLTSVPTDRAIVAAYETGAVMAFLAKEADIDPLLDSIRQVAQGHALLDAFTVRDASARLDEYGVHQLDALGERELKIAQLVAGGLSDTQIAEQLHVSLSTVRNALSSMYSKLSIERRTQLVRLVWLARSDSDIL